jgi:thymidylate synthase (FAD)
MTVEIETTRAIAAQLLRHRSFTFQEFSLRYARSTGRAVVPSVRLQDEKNRQSSLPNPDEALDAWWVAEAGRVMDDAEEIYRRAIEKGVAKEVARFVLPLATPTRLYMTGSVRSWLHYLKARLDPATQLEHRDLAEAVANVFGDEFPVVSEACGLWKKDVDVVVAS